MALVEIPPGLTETHFLAEGNEFQLWWSPEIVRITYGKHTGVTEMKVTVAEDGDWWGWYAPEETGKKLNFIFDSKSLVEMCFPYGAEIEEKKGKRKSRTTSCGGHQMIRFECVVTRQEDGARLEHSCLAHSVRAAACACIAEAAASGFFDGFRACEADLRISVQGEDQDLCALPVYHPEYWEDQRPAVLKAYRALGSGFFPFSADEELQLFKWELAGIVESVPHNGVKVFRFTAEALIRIEAWGVATLVGADAPALREV